MNSNDIRVEPCKLLVGISSLTLEKEGPNGIVLIRPWGVGNDVSD
jgi:hypothetical protein